MHYPYLHHPDQPLMSPVSPSYKALLEKNNDLQLNRVIKNDVEFGNQNDRTRGGRNELSERFNASDITLDDSNTSSGEMYGNSFQNPLDFIADDSLNYAQDDTFLPNWDIIHPTKFLMDSGSGGDPVLRADKDLDYALTQLTSTIENPFAEYQPIVPFPDFSTNDFLSPPNIGNDYVIQELPTNASNADFSSMDSIGSEGDHSDYNSDNHRLSRHSSSGSCSSGNDDQINLVGQPQPSKKKRRVLFSKAQLFELEKKFRQQKYLSSQEREEFAEVVKLSPLQLKIWFQNRRYKSKNRNQKNSKNTSESSAN